MCRFLAFWGTNPVPLAHLLIESENCLLKQSKKDESRRPNPDGWGFAYRDGSSLKLIKRAMPAFKDEMFIKEARKIYSDLLFAHVRRKSYGEVRFENTHPFVHKNWIFMHNGNIPDLHSFKTKLIKKLPKEIAIETKGTTDSEFLFKYFLKFFELNNNCDLYCVLNIIYNIIRQLVQMVKPEDQHLLALNFVLTNSEYIIGFRRNRTLYYYQTNKNTIIASEKVTNQPGWNEVPENHFIVCIRPGEVKLAAFDIIELKNMEFNSLRND